MDRRSLALGLWMAGVGSLPVGAATYTQTTLSYPGSSRTTVTGINDLGQITRYFFSAGLAVPAVAPARSDVIARDETSPIDEPGGFVAVCALVALAAVRRRI